ncbi:MAG: M1 family metallopeptidase [Thermoanaerobaculia bacterium]|nr:M1 family metallopeptidase [Thermoanaerobaculia bacterium]
MKTRLIAVLLLALALPTLVAAADPQPPELRLPEVARPVLMTVDLTILPEQETFDGKVGIDLELAGPASFLWLNARHLEIQSATLRAGGKESAVRVVAGGDDFAGFDFGRELPAGKAHLAVRYRGKLDAVETEGLFRQKDGEDWYAFSQFESTFARRAFPCFDEPSYRTPWQLTLHVKEGNVAVSNAPQVASRPEANGMKAVEFAPTKPISSYLVALGVGPFKIVDAGTWGRSKTPVRMVVAKGKEGLTGYAAEVTGPLLAALEEYFEIPYPFGKLDNLAVPQTVGFGAMENPGLVTYVDRLILADPARQTLERQRAYAGTAAHENAHMWFGDYVTMKWWDDIWLNEGFATWMAGKIVAQWKPEWGGEDENAGRRSSAMGADSLASSQPVRRPIRNQGDIQSAFDGISYAKGGALLSMFETWMGPERFRKGVQRYMKTHAWGNATSDDFLAALAAEGAPEVARSFATFLDQPGVPVVSVAVTCEGGKGKLALAQRRYVPLGSPVSKSQLWQVPVTLRYGAGARSETAKVLLDTAAKSTDLAFCPDWVQANHGGFGYYVAQYSGRLLEQLSALATTLPIAEQMALLDDTRFLFSAGDLSPESALGILPRFTDSTSRLVLDSVLDLATSVDDNLVADAARPNYERYLVHLFGARGQKLGFAKRDGESLDDTLLRPAVQRALGITAADPATRAEARRLTEAWFEDPKAIGPEMLGSVLAIAATTGDAALFDRFEAAARKEQDRRTRGQILAALGQFRDPAAVEKGLQLVLSGKFDVREAGGVAWGLSGDRVSRAMAYDWVKRSFDPLAAAMPEQYTAALVYMAIGYCDTAHRDEIAAFFGPRVQKLSGGQNNLDRVLDVVNICIGRRDKQEAGVSAFLKAY